MDPLWQSGPLLDDRRTDCFVGLQAVTVFSIYLRSEPNSKIKLNELPHTNTEVADVASTGTLNCKAPISLSRRNRRSTVIRVTAAAILSTITLGLVILDSRLGVAALGGLIVAAAVVSGFAHDWSRFHSVVVVRIGESEIRIRFINMPLDGEQKQAFLTGLADYVLRQQHAQLEPHSDR